MKSLPVEKARMIALLAAERISLYLKDVRQEIIRGRTRSIGIEEITDVDKKKTWS